MTHLRVYRRVALSVLFGCKAITRTRRATHARTSRHPPRPRPSALPDIPLLLILAPQRLHRRLPARVERRHHHRVPAVLPEHVAQREQPRLQLAAHPRAQHAQRVVRRLRVRREHVRRVLRERPRERLGLPALPLPLLPLRAVVPAHERLREQRREQPRERLAFRRAQRLGRRVGGRGRRGEPAREGVHDESALLRAKLGARRAEARDEPAERMSEVRQGVQDEVTPKADERTEGVHDAVEDCEVRAGIVGGGTGQKCLEEGPDGRKVGGTQGSRLGCLSEKNEGIRCVEAHPIVALTDEEVKSFATQRRQSDIAVIICEEIQASCSVCLADFRCPCDKSATGPATIRRTHLLVRHAIVLKKDGRD